MSDQRIGSEVAGYRIEGVVGRGGMSVVYLALDPGLKRKVALKVLSPELAEDQRFRDRFIRESQLAASLEHPNIVPIHEAGDADGVLFIAMRYVRGTDLKSLIARDGPLAPGRTASIVSQVASGLDAAHTEDLIHRDVKPSNVLVSEPDRSGAEHAYLTDFGLIRRVTHATSLTKTGQFMGTLDYVAPEQIRGDAVDGRADVYSLGCLLYECLTGQPPYVSELEVTILYGHLEEPPPSVTAHRPELPEAIDDVVARAMAKKPEDRYQSAGELAAAARLALATKAVRERPPSALAPGRRRLVLPAAIVAVAVVIAVLLVLLVPRHKSSLTGGSPPAPGASASGPGAAGPPPLGSVIQLDPTTRKVLTTARDAVQFTGGGNPRIAVGEGAVWAYVIQFLSHIDERTGRLEDTIYTGAGGPGPLAVAVGARTVWVPIGDYNGAQPNRLLPVDPATDQPLSPIGLGAGAFATDTAVGAGSVWVTLTNGGLVEVDPATHRILDTFPVGGHLDAMTFGFGSVWVIDEVAGQVVRVDPHSGRILATVGVRGNVRAITAGSGAVWVLDPISGTVAAIDPGTNTLGPAVRVGEHATGVAAGLGAVWVSDSGGSVYRVDPVTQSATAIPVGGPLTAIAVDPQAGTLWLSVGGGPA
jgi:serine/threonine protein kinase/DNA-binding beta-propeller fold protein YncE